MHLNDYQPGPSKSTIRLVPTINITDPKQGFVYTLATLPPPHFPETEPKIALSR